MPSPPRHLLDLADTETEGVLLMLRVLYDYADADALAAHLRGEGPPPFVWPTWAELQQVTNKSRSTVADRLARLAEIGQVRRACREVDGRVVQGFELTPVQPDSLPSGRIVYFLQCEPDGLVKIGFTTNIGRRKAQLEEESGSRLRLLGFRWGGRAEELVLHRQLAPHRVDGEWFKPSPPVLAAAREGV
jgi:hypothetical protein